MTLSGVYYLDPDGPGSGSKPVQIYCDMATGTSRVGHSSPGEMKVSSCSEGGCFVHRVTYDVPGRQISALMALSEKCEQKIKVFESS